MEHVWPALIGVAIGNRTPWLFGLALRLVRGQSARDAAAKVAEAAREQREIERLTVRCADLEVLVDLLRRALDRHLIRESAIASACELLIMVAAMVPQPTDAMLRIRDRAQQLLEDARAQTLKINGRGSA
jgi:hypothetical protein